MQDICAKENIKNSRAVRLNVTGSGNEAQRICKKADE